MKTHPKGLNKYRNFHPKLSCWFIALFIFCGIPSFAFANEEAMVSRLDFVSMMAKNQPDNALIPSNSKNLSADQLYTQVAKNLQVKGFNVLTNKPPQEMLTHKEFVRLTYAFNGGKPGKSLFHQKMYLKQAQIISTADVGLTTGLDGKATQAHADTKKDQLAELAGPVFMKDKIETDLNSMMEVTFDDESNLALGEDASVRITRHIYDPDKDLRQTIVKMSSGIVRFVVTKGKAPGSLFQVVTPVAIAGVRGTEFVVKVDPDGTTTFIGIEGEIETAPVIAGAEKGAHNFVTLGKMQKISPDGSTRGVFEASPGLMERVIRLTTPTTVLAKKSGIDLAKASKVATQKINLKEIEMKVEPQLASMVGGSSTGVAGTTVGLDTVGGVLGTVNNLTGQLTDTLDGVTGQALGVAGDTVNNATGAVNGVGDPAVRAAQNAAAQAAQKAAQTAAQTAAQDAAIQAAKDSARKASMESAKENIKMATQELVQAQGNISGGVPNPASVTAGVTGVAGSTASGATGTVGTTAGSVGSTVGGAVGGVGGGLGGGGGGLGGLGGGLGGLGGGLGGGGGGGLLP